jgi:formate transporter
MEAFELAERASPVPAPPAESSTVGLTATAANDDMSRPPSVQPEHKALVAAEEAPLPSTGSQGVAARQRGSVGTVGHHGARARSVPAVLDLPSSLAQPPAPHIELHPPGTPASSAASHPAPSSQHHNFASAPVIDTEMGEASVPLRADSSVLLSKARQVYVVPNFTTELLKARQAGERKPFHQKLFKTPKEAAAALEIVSTYKVALRTDRLVVLSFFSGVMISFGGLFALTVAGGLPGVPIGIVKLLLGLCFQVALSLIMIFGGDLFSGDSMILTIGLLLRAISWRGAARVLVVSYLANCAGAVFGAAFFGYWTDLYASEPWLAFVQNLAVEKCTYAPHVAFLRGVACNWLICMAVWMALCAESVEGKILAGLLPVTAFAASGFEHAIANMFFVPVGLMYGAPVSFGQFIARNLILVTLGNAVAGALFMAPTIWWVFLEGRRSPSPKERA